MITFTIPGEPIPQPRHRFAGPGEPIPQPRHRFAGGGKFPSPYIPGDHPVHAYKIACQTFGKHAFGYGETPWDGPIKLIAVFVASRPKKYQAKRFDRGRLWFDVKPDHDNFLKSLCDALTGITWVDDCQVCDSHAQKFYAAVGEEPHTIVQIERIT